MTKIQEKYAELNDKHNACVSECIALRKEVEQLRLVAKRAFRLDEDNTRLRKESWEDGQTIAKLQAIIDNIDSLWNDLGKEPGELDIKMSEAVRRILVKQNHPAFKEPTS